MLRQQSGGPVNLDTGEGGRRGRRGVAGFPRYRPCPVLSVNFDIGAAAFMLYGQFNVSGEGDRLG